MGNSTGYERIIEENKMIRKAYEEQGMVVSDLSIQLQAKTEQVQNLMYDK